MLLVVTLFVSLARQAVGAAVAGDLMTAMMVEQQQRQMAMPWLRGGLDDLFTSHASEGCWDALTQCSNQTMTQGRCRSVIGALQLNLARNDFDANCVASPVDYKPDLLDFYDPNGDEVFTQKEWSDRRTAYLAWPRELTDSEWVQLIGSADGNFSVGDLKFFPPQMLKTAFANSNQMRLVTWCNEGGRGRYESSAVCAGLVVLCRDVAKDTDACKQVPQGVQSLKQKLDLNRSFNDKNGDGTATFTEVLTDIQTYYDVNNDGCATVQEWVSRWTSFYGFSAEFGEAFFNGVNSDGGPCVDAAGGTEVRNNIGDGVESSFFPNTLMSILVGMCEATPSLYESNKDCAMVMDTCRMHFKELPACQAYAGCGALAYRACVEATTEEGKACSSGRDATEADLERLRIENVLAKDCKPASAICKDIENRAYLRYMAAMGMRVNRAKAGSCPKVQPGTVGVCGGTFCADDSGCPGAQKCCASACGGNLCTNV